MGDYVICRLDRVRVVAAGQTVTSGTLWAVVMVRVPLSAPLCSDVWSLVPRALSLFSQPTQHFSELPGIL